MPPSPPTATFNTLQFWVDKLAPFISTSPTTPAATTPAASDSSSCAPYTIIDINDGLTTAVIPWPGAANSKEPTRLILRCDVPDSSTPTSETLEASTDVAERILQLYDEVMNPGATAESTATPDEISAPSESRKDAVYILAAAGTKFTFGLWEFGSPGVQCYNVRSSTRDLSLDSGLSISLAQIVREMAEFARTGITPAMKRQQETDAKLAAGVDAKEAEKAEAQCEMRSGEANGGNGENEKAAVVGDDADGVRTADSGPRVVEEDETEGPTASKVPAEHQAYTPEVEEPDSDSDSDSNSHSGSATKASPPSREQELPPAAPAEETTPVSPTLSAKDISDADIDDALDQAGQAPSTDTKDPSPAAQPEPVVQLTGTGTPAAAPPAAPEVVAEPARDLSPRVEEVEDEGEPGGVSASKAKAGVDQKLERRTTGFKRGV